MPAFLERELQEYLEGDGFAAIGEAMAGHVHLGSLNLRLVAPQVRCRYGVIDLLAVWNELTPVVIELKARKADGRAASQLLRYAKAVEDAYSRVYYDQMFAEGLEELPSMRGWYSITTILIAPDFDDDALLLSDWNLLAKHPDNKFRLEVASSPKDRPQEQLEGMLRPFALGLLGREFGQGLNAAVKELHQLADPFLD